MKKITCLTPEQESLIPVHVEKWKKIAFSTEPINFKLSKESIIKLYEFNGLKPPKQITKILSPTERRNISVDDDTVYESFCDIDYAVSDTVDYEISDKINRKISNAINRNMNTHYTTFDTIYRGSVWCDYYAHYSFFRDILKIKLPEIYNVAEQLALNSTFCLFKKNTAYVCDRPKSINIDNRARPHNTSGPAIQWRDNFKQWYIEGIPVDEQIVLKPETQTIEQINKEKYEDIRRIRIERYGWIQYLEHSKAKLINSRINERDNQQEQLYEHEQSNRFICVDPSTGRKYAIAVPRRIRTCITAQKYLSHGLDKFAIHRS